DFVGPFQHRQELRGSVSHHSLASQPRDGRIEPMSAENRLQPLDLQKRGFHHRLRRDGIWMDNSDGNGRSHLESRLTPTSQPYPLDRREADPASEDERDSGGSCNPQRLSSRYLLRFVAHDPLFTAGAIWTSLVRTLSMSCRQTPAFSISFVSQALQRTH